MSDSSLQFPVIRKLVVIGIGLIGGSFAAGLKKRGACKEVIGISRSSKHTREAIELQVVDRGYQSIEEMAKNEDLSENDLIFIAVPTLSVKVVLFQIESFVKTKIIITDGTSVKGYVLEAAKSIFGVVPPEFVLGHPIAGSEKSGVTAANPDLYEKHRVILTPLDNTDQRSLRIVKSLWEILGAEVLSMSVDEHDEVLAATSHLPHAIAYSLVDTLANDIGNPNIFRYAAGGFRDFTRIASSDPEMWHDIMLANREAILKSLDLFIDNLMRLRANVETESHEGSEYLFDMFHRAKTARDEYTKMLKK